MQHYMYEVSVGIIYTKNEKCERYPVTRIVAIYMKER